MNYQRYREYQKRLDAVSSLTEAGAIWEALGQEARDTRREAIEDQLVQVLVEKGIQRPS